LRVSKKGNNMRKEIHPTSVECKVTCACGNTFETSSTKDTLGIDICNECHPFFTGSEKIVDTAGRIEKFNKRYNMAK
jgi:large subunit ribosomal protein L31